MNSLTSIANRTYRHFKADSLFRNSVWLMASTGIMALCGFLFWAIAARHYSPSSIGIASTLISAITFLSTLCLLGLNITLINHLPKSKQPSSLINSGVAIVSVFALVGSAAFALAASYYSPQLSFLHTSAFFLISFVVFTILSTADTVTEGALIAFKNSGAVVVKNSLYSIVKVFLVVALIGAGLKGLLSAYYLGLLICFVISYVSLRRRHAYRLLTKITRASNRTVMKTSLGNYAESISMVLPPALLPLLITTKLGASQTAYFYLAMVIANTIYAIPKAVARNVIAEMSSSQNLGDASASAPYRHGIKVLTGILIPVVAIIIVLGKIILGIFGPNYSLHGYIPLVFLVISVIPIAASSMFWARMNVVNDSLSLLWVNILGGLAIVALSYSFLAHGLTAVSIAWLTGQTIQTGLYAVALRVQSRRRSLSAE